MCEMVALVLQATHLGDVAWQDLTDEAALLLMMRQKQSWTILLVFQ